MSFDDLFTSVVPYAEEAPYESSPWWLSYLDINDPIQSFDAFKEQALLRLKRLDDRCVTEIASFLHAWAQRFALPPPRLFVHRASGSVSVGSVDAAFFATVTGHYPSNDDLHRVNCEEAGAVGHATCGWCDHCEQPRFVCGHLRFMRVGAKP